jgi:hypothetical protein
MIPSGRAHNEMILGDGDEDGGRSQPGVTDDGLALV